MYDYQIIDLNLGLETMTVLWSDQSSINIKIPRNDQGWITGQQLDQFISVFHPSYTQNQDQSQVSSRLEQRYQADLLLQTPRPHTEPQYLIDLVIAHRQTRFLDMTQQSSPLTGQAELFTGDGSHTWRVPGTMTWARFSIFSSGQADHEQGPGMMWSSGCLVEPGDTVFISIGTETTMTSSLGTVTVGSGWTAPGQVPRELYKILPWGHWGRAGAVIIY